jgi:hypothetical protein
MKREYNADEKSRTIKGDECASVKMKLTRGSQAPSLESSADGFLDRPGQ